MTQQTSVNSFDRFSCVLVYKQFFLSGLLSVRLLLGWVGGWGWGGGGGPGCKKDIQADSIISLCMIV